MPAPLLNGNGGTLSFSYTENLLDYTDEETDPVSVTICLLNIGPADGLNSIGGSFSGNFDWQYDAVSNCFLGTQNQDILGGSGGTITVDFDQTNTVQCPNNQMGFNANIQPAACMNGVNDVNDDAESVFTCNLDSPLPSISVLDTVYNEDAGAVNALVCLDSVVSVDVSFGYTITDGTALTPMDYTAVTPSSATILAGNSCTTLPLTIIDDAVVENTENVVVDIFNPSNAMIQDNSGLVTILDNDVAPVEPGISVSDDVVVEGQNAVVQVCIDETTTVDVSVDLSTANGSALAGSDYNMITNQTVTIPAGDPDNCVDVVIGTIDDTDAEPTENFTVNLTNPVNGTLVDPVGEVTITDNDDPCEAEAPVLSGN